MERCKILAEAADLTGGDRNETYGPPSKNLSDTAALWSAYLEGKFCGRSPQTENTLGGFALTAEDVAWFNVLQKMSRSFAGYHRDNYLDAAAYTAIAGECAKEDRDFEQDMGVYVGADKGWEPDYDL